WPSVRITVVACTSARCRALRIVLSGLPRPPCVATKRFGAVARRAALCTRAVRMEWSIASVSRAISRSSADPVRATRSNTCGGTMKRTHAPMPDFPPLDSRHKDGGHARVARARAGVRSGLVQLDCLAQLFEEALRHLLGLSGQAAHLAERRLLVCGEVGGYHDLDHHELVATATRAHVRHPPASQPERLAVLSAGRTRDLYRPVHRGHVDPVA